MRLRLTPQAVKDIAEIADYVRAESPSAAKRVQAAIVETLHMLVQFPELGRPQALETVRKAVVRTYPYLVYYSVGVEELVIFDGQTSGSAASSRRQIAREPSQLRLRL